MPFLYRHVVLNDGNNMRFFFLTERKSLKCFCITIAFVLKKTSFFVSNRDNIMGELSILAPSGAENLTWGTEASDEIMKAKERFQLLLKEGYLAFHLNDNGGEGKKISTFDAAAKKIIMIPKLGGG